VQPPGIDHVLAVALDKLAADLLEVVGGHLPGGIGHALEHQGLGHGLVVLLLGDPALHQYAAQHVFLAGLGRIEVAEGL
jgi:hypothetical protein